MINIYELSVLEIIRVGDDVVMMISDESADSVDISSVQDDCENDCDNIKASSVDDK